MSDMDQDLNDIIDDVPVDEPQVAEEPQAEPEAAQAEPEPETPPEPAATPEMVPQAVVGELRGENRALKAQVDQLTRGQQPAPTTSQEPPPDFFENPAGAVQHQIAPLQQAILGQKLQSSRFHAEQQYGAETVQAAYDYFEANPALSQALVAHPSPFHAAVKEYQKVQVAQEVGDDPIAYRDKVRAEIRAEMEKELAAKQTADAVHNAPSLAGQTSIGGRTTSAAPTLTPLDDILG